MKHRFQILDYVSLFVRITHNKISTLSFKRFFRNLTNYLLNIFSIALFLISLYILLIFIITPKDPYITSMEHHTDWVNEILLCCNGKTCQSFCVPKIT